MKKRLISLTAVLALLVSLLAFPAQAEGVSFTDVSSDDYYYQAVQWALDKQVTNGTSETTFSPKNTCTRAQVVTFLWRAAGRPEPEAAENPFTDVPAGEYYEKPVLWAVEKGITNGTSQTKFSPDDTCLCAQIVTFLWRYAGRPAPGASELTAAWPESYYRDAVSWADVNGLLAGTGADFQVAAPCSRALTVYYLWGMENREKNVAVSNAKELFAAIAPHTTVTLAPGVYDLSDWVESLPNNGSAPVSGNPYVTFENVGDGWQVNINGVEGLTLYGEYAGQTAIVTKPRYANVLCFNGCSDVGLVGLVVGHTPDQGHCTGAVLRFETCADVALHGLDLYGCGTYGLEAYNVVGLTMGDSVIRDCTYGIMTLYSVLDASFERVACRNCHDTDMLEIFYSTAVFKDCWFTGNSWGEWFAFLKLDAYSAALFDGCTFDRNAYSSLISEPHFNRTVFISNQIVVR